MEIQKYLRAGYPLEMLTAIGVYHNRHPNYPNLVQFNYDSAESFIHKTNSIVQECRGLILDEKSNWSIIARSFKRFANVGESWAANIDWKTARVQEKVDGSLIIMYHYDGKWHVATRGSIDASGPVGAWTRTKLVDKISKEIPWTFSDLFWSSCEYWLKGLSKSGVLHPDLTYMFELTSPLNQIVCDYTITGMSTAAQFNEVTGKYDLNPFEFEDDQTGYGHDGSRITLLGVCNRVYGFEIPVSEFKDDFHYVVQEFPLTTLEEIIDAAKKLDPKKQEGFVVVDSEFNRIKIKSPEYVLIHYFRDRFGPRRLTEMIQNGEDEEILSYYPEYKKQFVIKQNAYTDLCKRMDECWEDVNAKVGPNASQKEFALEAIKTNFSGYLFSKRKASLEANTPVEFLKGMPTDRLMDLL